MVAGKGGKTIRTRDPPIRQSPRHKRQESQDSARAREELLDIAGKNIARQRGLLPRHLDTSSKSTTNLHNAPTQPEPLSPRRCRQNAATSPEKGTRRRLTKQYGRFNDPEEPTPAEKITHGQRLDNDGKAMDDQSVPHGFTSGANGSGNVNAEGKRKRLNNLTSRVYMAVQVEEPPASPTTMENITEGNTIDQLPQSSLAGDGSGAINAADCVGKRTRLSKLSTRLAMGLQVDEAAEPPHRENISDAIAEEGIESTNAGGGSTNDQGTSKDVGKSTRGRYKSYAVDMKIKGKGSKLKIEIPEDIDRVIGENARSLVNECGRVVRTRAPLNVTTWQEAFTQAGDSMCKEIQDKFQIVESSQHVKLMSFVMDTMQRLYRLWKSRLHYYYKTEKCGKTDEERLKNPPPDLSPQQWAHCVKRFGSEEFKLISERNSKNRLSTKRCTHTTGSLSFAEVEDKLTTENNNVKPSADVVWLVEHTTKTPEGELQWADDSSKQIHEKLKQAVDTTSDEMTQEQILLDVLGPRSGYIRGKGTAVRFYSKGVKQLATEKIVEQQHGILKEQHQEIQNLKKKMEETHERQQRELEEYKAEQQRAMEAFKKELLESLANRDVEE